MHFSIVGHLDWFHNLAIVNTASVNTTVKVALQRLRGFGINTQAGAAGSYGGSIFGVLSN